MHRYLLRTLLTALPVTALLAPTADAAVFPAAYTGFVCVPFPNSTNTDLIYRSSGVGNRRSDSNSPVQCTGPQISGTAIKTIRVNVIDNTPASGDFCCSANILDVNGVPVMSVGQTCAFGSGAQTITLNVDGVGLVYVGCSIPRVNTSNQASFVTSFSYQP